GEKKRANATTIWQTGGGTGTTLTSGIPDQGNSRGYGTSNMPWLPATAATIVIVASISSSQWTTWIRPTMVPRTASTRLERPTISGSPTKRIKLKISHTSTIACIHQNSIESKRSQRLSLATI